MARLRSLVNSEYTKIFAILVLASMRVGGDSYYTKWTMFYLGFCVLGVYVIAANVHVSAALAWAWCTGFGIFTSSWIFNSYRTTDLWKRMGETSLTSLLTLFVPLLIIHLRHYKILRKIMAWICVVGGMYSLAMYSTGITRIGLFDNNPSMFGCLIATTIPFMFAELPLFFGFIPVMAVIVIGEKMPVICLFSISLVYYFYRFHSVYTRRVVLSVFSASIVFISIFMFIKGDYVISNGRFSFWRLMMGTWSYTTIQANRAGQIRIPEGSKLRLDNMAIGSGTGSYLPIAENLQLKTMIGLATKTLEYGAKTNVSGIMITMHSDVLQILFEQGIIGLLLCLVMLFFAWRRTVGREDWVLLSALFGSIIWCCGNYPMRSAVPAFILICIIYLCFCDNENIMKTKGEINHG